MAIRELHIKRPKEIYGSSNNHGPYELYYYNIKCSQYFASMINQDFEEYKKVRESEDEPKSLKLPYSLIDILLNYSIKINSEETYISLRKNMYKIAKFVLDYDIVTNRDISSTEQDIDNIVDFALSPGQIETESWNQPYIDLPHAAQMNALNVVKYFVKKGVDPNCSHGAGYPSALDFAFQDNNFEMVKFLIEHGADVNWSHYDYMPRYDLDKSEDFDKNLIIFEIIKFLLKQNLEDFIKIDVEDDYNTFTNFFISKSKERSDLLREELIVKYYSPENIEKWSVLYGKDLDEVQEIM